MKNPTTPTKYQSKGRTISKSTHHKGMYIIDSGETFHLISSSEDQIQQLYPKDKPKQKKK